jgi:hypothetical protein
MDLDQDTLDKINIIRAQHEFLTFLVLEHEIVFGIIQNETQKIMMLYNIEKLRDLKQRERFLRFGDEWWWESNQQIPIDSYIGNRFDEFRQILIGYPKKSVINQIGPTFNLSEQYLKRIKKKKIEILRA